MSAAITRITDELPSPADVDRAQRRLVLHEISPIELEAAYYAQHRGPAAG